MRDLSKQENKLMLIKKLIGKKMLSAKCHHLWNFCWSYSYMILFWGYAFVRDLDEFSVTSIIMS